METNRLILRERTQLDLQKILKAPVIEQKQYFGAQNDEALAKEIERIHQGKYNNYYSGIYYDLLLKTTHEVIGSAGFHTWWRDHDRAEIGYGLTKDDYKQQGFMSEAVAAILQYGFDKMHLYRIEAFTAMDNAASIGLLTKFGFTLEATVHGHYKMADGTYEDDYLFYLLKN